MIEATKRKGKHRVKRHKQVQRRERKTLKKREENIHICPRVNEVTTPMSHFYTENNVCPRGPIR